MERNSVCKAVRSEASSSTMWMTASSLMPITCHGEESLARARSVHRAQPGRREVRGLRDGNGGPGRLDGPVEDEVRHLLPALLHEQDVRAVGEHLELGLRRRLRLLLRV